MADRGPTEDKSLMPFLSSGVWLPDEDHPGLGPEDAYSVL